MDTIVLDVLKEGRALIVKGWTQGNMAVTKRGRSVGASNPKAARFCSLGAIKAASLARYSNAYYPVFDAATVKLTYAARDLGKTGIVDLNDTAKSKKIVLEAFDIAITGMEAAS